jgi:hypothetical protein
MMIRLLILLVICFSQLKVIASPIYTSTFEDAGFTVTQTKHFIDGRTEQWEWLDLTVTNGMSFSGIQDDINDNGVLDNSQIPLTGWSGSLADVYNLPQNLTTGWSTVSSVEALGLLTQFFTLQLFDNAIYDFQAESDNIETFISMFGDTYQEGYSDSGGQLPNGTPSIVHAVGKTNSIVTADRVRTVFVSDATFNGGYIDGFDTINTRNRSHINANFVNSGTFLNRQVVVVSSPPMFFLILLILTLTFFSRDRSFF